MFAVCVSIFVVWCKRYKSAAMAERERQMQTDEQTETVIAVVIDNADPVETAKSTVAVSWLQFI